MRTVHSFDVFDTVLTRTIGTPEAVLRLLGERVRSSNLLPDLDATSFATSRSTVERDLNAWSDSHVDLRAIHREIARRCGYPGAVAEQLARMEEELERELVVAVPGAETRLTRLRVDGAQIIFVSDTPHTEAFVGELLASCGISRPEDRVFTSSARGVSKSRGGLFRAVADELGLRDVRHHGDDIHSDVASARWERWEAAWLPTGRLTRYEQVLASADDQTAGLGSLLAGSSRLARLAATERGVPAAVAQVATGVMAPMLVGYVAWCLRQAQARGLQRLYFVARDGEVMLRAARTLSFLAPDIELRYLWGSRQPWVLGASASHPELLESWILGRTDFTARTALHRLGIDPAPFYAATRFGAAAPARLDSVMSRAEREHLGDLVRHEPWHGLVTAAAQLVAERCTSYVRQEGLVEGVSYGVVDAGWSGRASAALDQLVRGAGGTPGPHFYVGQLGRAEEASLREGVQIEPWLFDRQGMPGSLGNLTSPNVLVEMFCSGTTGRTVDYARTPAGETVPVLDRAHNTEALAWGIVAAQDAALDAVARTATSWPQAATHVDLTRATRRVLTMFWEHPTATEVGTWGTFPGEEEIWPPFMDLAQPISTASVAGRLRRGETMLRPNNTWRAGSIAVSRPPWSWMAAARGWYQVTPRSGRSWMRRQAIRALRVWARRSSGS